MKFIALALALSTLSSFAATVHKARLDVAKENILIDVSYDGGCKRDTFSLKLKGCAESFPVQCQAELVHKTVGGLDMCEVIISETVKINLSQYRLDESYYSRGSLTITGDMNVSGKPSSATIILP